MYLPVISYKMLTFIYLFTYLFNDFVNNSDAPSTDISIRI
jgi:hypothetical protein